MAFSVTTLECSFIQPGGATLRRLAVIVAVLGSLAAVSPAVAAVRITGPARIVLPESFAGVSVETDLLPSWFSVAGCQSPAREVLRMAGRPEIRIGGNSQDRLWPVAPLPEGQHQVADRPFFHAVRCVGAARSPVLLGLNLLGRDPAAAGDLLAAAGGLVPREQLTIAIGNEPNLYGRRLPPPGGYAGYLQLYGQTLQELRHRFGSFLPPVGGPDAAAYRWAREAEEFVRQERPDQADVHLYGLNGCRRPEAPTVQQLLAPAASTDLVRDLAGVARAARQLGIPAQISETNTVACRGAAGVSDSPAAALWALKLMGVATRVGFSRLQFHASGSIYDPFVLTLGRTVAFRPLWTAILLANALWPAGSEPRTVRGHLPAGLGVWAARRADGGLGVLAVNSDVRHAHRTDVRTAAHRAVLGRVTPRGRFAVALNGRQLRWSHGRPRWSGATRMSRRRIRHGRLELELAPATAAWLVLDGGSSPTPASLTR